MAVEGAGGDAVLAWPVAVEADAEDGSGALSNDEAIDDDIVWFGEPPQLRRELAGRFL